MNLGIVLPSGTGGPGGGMKVAYEYVNSLAERGHSVTIYFWMESFLSIRKPYCYLPPVLKRICGRNIMRWMPRWFTFDARVKKRGIYNEKEIGKHDIIIATAIATAYIVNSLPEKCGKKAYFIQGFENWKCSDEDVYKTYAMGMRNITVAKWLSLIVDAHAQTPSVCISNSIDTRIFCLRKPIAQRPRHSLSFHYRSMEYKGSRFAIEAVRLLEKKYADLQVTVVSSEQNPGDLPSCCNFVFRATPKEVAEINNSVAVFMCSSIIEGFGLPGLEAMACGCALVSTDYPGVHEYAEDGENALLCPVRDANALACAIEKLFIEDDLRFKLANAGMATAAKRSLNHAVDQFEQTLLEMCN